MHVTTVAAAGVDLVVREWGVENPEPLFFWPALSPWGSLQLVEAAPLLAQRGFRVVSIAAPGMGESPSLADTDAYRPTRLADLVLAVADASFVERFSLVGASWGGSIGVQLAVAHPERIDALALLDGGYADSPTDVSVLELEQQLAAEQQRFTFEGWDAYFEWAREHTRRWSDPLEERYRAGMRQTANGVVPRADARAAARALHGLSVEPVSETHPALGRAGVPTLLIVPVDADESEAIARFQVLVPQAAIERVDAGHDIVHDQPDQAAEIIGTWLTAAGLRSSRLAKSSFTGVPSSHAIE